MGIHLVFEKRTAHQQKQESFQTGIFESMQTLEKSLKKYINLNKLIMFGTYR